MLTFITLDPDIPFKPSFTLNVCDCPIEYLDKKTHNLQKAIWVILKSSLVSLVILNKESFALSCIF